MSRLKESDLSSCRRCRSLGFSSSLVTVKRVENCSRYTHSQNFQNMVDFQGRMPPLCGTRKCSAVLPSHCLRVHQLCKDPHVLRNQGSRQWLGAAL